MEKCVGSHLFLLMHGHMVKTSLTICFLHGLSFEMVLPGVYFDL